MKIFCIMLCFIFTTGYCQETIINTNSSKCQISIIASGHYKTFYNKKYIAPTEGNISDILSHQYEVFFKVPTYGFRVGLILSVKTYKKVSILTGLSYFKYRDRYESDFDSIMKYYEVEYRDCIYNVLKYNYSYHNIEMPLMLQYKMKEINVYGGIWLELLSFYKTIYTYIPRIEQSPYFIKDGKSTVKSFNYSKKSLQIIPFINVSYTMRIRDIVFYPYTGIDFGKKESIFINLGVTMPLTDFQKKQTSKN